MDFDRFTVSLLVPRPDPPEQDDATAGARQDAHLSHLADLHEAGHLLAVGPLLGPPERAFRGLSVYALPPDEVREITGQDPGVRAGRYRSEILPWLVPSGAMTFSRTRLPRSMAEAGSGMPFDRFSVELLILRVDEPRLDAVAADVLQDGHLSHLADLHDAGELLAAGPLRGDVLQGLGIFRVEPERARELAGQDPAVRAGKFRFEVLPWMVPGGAVAFAHTRFPRSVAEVRG
ncbi:MAG TPA: YciI family protein [Thermomicrobiaceae bacterium]|nr:YciI family protein [Thermomicrobiaceae bacterium]